MAPSSEVGLPACGPGARSSSPSYYPRPRNEAAIRRSASRLYRRRHRENLEREPVDLSQSKKKSRADRFGISFKFNGRSRSLQRGTVPSINDDPDSVQLIGFRRVKARSHSAEDSSPSRSISSEDSNRDQEELVKEPAVHQNEMERQESFRKLVKDSQEWLRSGINDGEFWTPSEQMGKFFEEAQTKSSEASNEEFAEFIQRNRESFNRCKGNSICMDRGIFSGDRRLLETRASGTKRLVDRDSGIFTEQEVQAGSASSSSTNSSSRSSHAFQRHIRMVKSTSHDAHEQSVHKVSAVHRTESQIKTSGTQPEFKTIIELNGDNNQPPDFQMRPDSLSMASSEPQLRAAILKRPLSEFPTRFTPMSPPNLPNRMSTGFDANMSSSYHFSTSRSRFQYCGETNTFKFSTEHVSSSFSEQGYESVSESEDEESVDVDSASETSSHTERSELGSQSTVSNAPRSESCVTLNAAETQQKTQNALREIAYELLTTERTYVSILRLLNQVYVRVDLENRKAAMFSQDVITGMFANLNSLYKFHNDFVLTKLEERLQSWESNPRIGDLMREWAPFLKMYTEYVKNYDTAMHLIGTWYQKQPRFARIMDEVHSLPECGKLQVSHHMLTPVQRIPRYELLLKEYLKKLPDDSPDREDTEKALELVATAAHHANEAMKKIHKFKKLLEIQELVGGVIDLVSPSRELLKEGKINKISARSGDTQERHLFVFNDLLVLCSQRLISQRVVSGPLYRVRARLEIDGLIVEKGDNLETPNSFYVRNTGRSIELCTLNSDEKLEWMQVLAKAVHDLAQKKSSLKVQRESDECDESPDSSELGLKAPDLVKSDSVSHCMNCATPFSAFGRWKHHCHACGIVACRKCLSQKMRLAYDSSRLLRVCDRCHKLLLQSGQLHSNDENNDENNFKSPPDSPVLPRADKAVMSGYLKLRTNGRSTWSRRWFALQPDFVLYSYKSQEDKLPLTSTPVPGFLVSRLEKGDAVDPKVPHTFKLFHVKKSYYFQANDSDEQEKWINALDQASRAEDLV